MTLVGKIFTVLILVMSVFFGAFAVAVFATHKNWRDVVLAEGGLKDQIQKERESIEQLKAVETKLQQELAAEKNDRAQQHAKLMSERSSMKDQLEELRGLQAESQKKVAESMAAMQASQSTLQALKDEVAKLRTDIEQAQNDVDAKSKAVIDLTDRLHQAVSEEKRLKERNLALAGELEKARSLMRLFDLDENRDYSGRAPRVEGQVLSTEGSDLVEISIGADDGLMRGHKLEVFRMEGGNTSYLGRIEIVKAEPDRAVGKIDTARRQGIIQKGDRVASKLD